MSNKPSATYAIVTGASSGIGYSFAEALAKRGYNLLIVSNVPEIHEAASKIKDQSPQTLVRRGLRALFHGRAKITVPTVFWEVLSFLILLIPTCILRLIRKLGWF